MKLSLYILFFVALFSGYIHSLKKGVEWNGNNWAYSCDFPGNDLTNVRAQGKQCGSLCFSTSGCTHWAFNLVNGGTCYLKKGSVSKSDVTKDDYVNSCGITGETTGDDHKDDDSTQQGSSALKKLTKCKFAYGRNWDNENTDYGPYDYATIWLNTPKENCKGTTCTDFNIYYQGVMINKMKDLGKTPVFYAYMIAFEARVAWGLQDCNVGYPSLCERGANYIRQNRDRILERYSHHSAAIAGILGKESFSVWLIEADLHQYHDSRKQEGGGLSGQYIRSLFDDIVRTIKEHLPNAAIGWDISPWVVNEPENMEKWWGYFSSSKEIDFITTSGGGSQGGSDEMIPGEAKWNYMHELTGKPIIGDTGYGVGGAGAANSGPWYESWNIDSRIKDGVCAVSIANANSSPTHKPNIC